jgi:hypothetical protein
VFVGVFLVYVGGVFDSLRVFDPPRVDWVALPSGWAGFNVYRVGWGFTLSGGCLIVVQVLVSFDVRDLIKLGDIGCRRIG